jgi:hypothetical protein
MYMSMEQVQQVADTHSDYLDRQLSLGRITQDEHSREMGELSRWYRRNNRF